MPGTFPHNSDLSPKARLAAPWVLVFWVSFLALTWLQPCCEAVAAAIPHGHPAGVGAPPHDDSHRSGHDRVTAREGGVEHWHCAQPLDLFEPLPTGVVITDRVVSDPDGGGADPVLLHLYPTAPARGSAQRVDPLRPRSPSTPVFLSTLRLRI